MGRPRKKPDLPSGLNNKLTIILIPNIPLGNRKPRRYHPIGVYQLYKYIGHVAAKGLITRALQCREDKYTEQLRKFGRIDFYFK